MVCGVAPTLTLFLQMGTSPFFGKVVSDTLNSAVNASPGPSDSYLRTPGPLASPGIANAHLSLTPKPLLLFYHFFAVAFYSLWLLFTRPFGDRKHAPTVLEYPRLMVQSVQVVGPSGCFIGAVADLVCYSSTLHVSSSYQSFGLKLPYNTRPTARAALSLVRSFVLVTRCDILFRLIEASVTLVCVQSSSRLYFSRCINHRHYICLCSRAHVRISRERPAFPGANAQRVPSRQDVY